MLKDYEIEAINILAAELVAQNKYKYRDRWIWYGEVL